VPRHRSGGGWTDHVSSQSRADSDGRAEAPADAAGSHHGTELQPYVYLAPRGVTSHRPLSGCWPLNRISSGGWDLRGGGADCRRFVRCSRSGWPVS
jgi:hypothetical protein